MSAYVSASHQLPCAPTAVALSAASAGSNTTSGGYIAVATASPEPALGVFRVQATKGDSGDSINVRVCMCTLVWCARVFLLGVFL